MALVKQVTVASGYVAEYFKIADIQQNKKTVKIKLDLYKDDTARNSGCSPIVSNYMFRAPSLTAPQTYSFELTDEQFANDNVYVCAYDYLKSLSSFSGAQDA